MSPGTCYDVFFKYRKTIKTVKCFILSDVITNTIPKCIDMLPDHHMGSNKRSTRSSHHDSVDDNDTVAAKKTRFESNIVSSESSDDDNVVTPKVVSKNQQQILDEENSLNASFGDVSLTDDLPSG